MFIRMKDAVVRGGGNIEVRNYITKELSGSFSLAVATLDGVHPPTMNTESDRAYFIVEGEATVEVGDAVEVLQAGDAVYIPKNTRHSIRGQVKYIVINAPPFNPSNEVSQ